MRLAGQAKGGFLPHTRRVVGMIAQLIRVPTTYFHYRSMETRRILDPCCGAGEALAQLAERLRHDNGVSVQTYGVELHTERAEAAAERPDHALSADLFQTSIANHAFGLCLLNPPYDSASDDKKRVEHAFLTTCTRYLDEGGLLVFIVPRHRLGSRRSTWPPTTTSSSAGPFPNRRGKPSTRLWSLAIAGPSPIWTRRRRGGCRSRPKGNRRPWSPMPTPSTGPPPPTRATSCSPPAASIRCPPLPRPGVRACGPARRSTTPSGRTRTSATVP